MLLNKYQMFMAFVSYLKFYILNGEKDQRHNNLGVLLSLFTQLLYLFYKMFFRKTNGRMSLEILKMTFV